MVSASLPSRRQCHVSEPHLDSLTMAGHFCISVLVTITSRRGSELHQVVAQPEVRVLHTCHMEDLQVAHECLHQPFCLRVLCALVGDMLYAHTGEVPLQQATVLAIEGRACTGQTRKVVLTLLSHLHRNSGADTLACPCSACP